MNLAQHILIVGVRLYRCTLSPVLACVCGPLARCRFTPSCSRYALEVIQTHGARRGSWLALKRLGRCHPWGGCGDDPVPAVHSSHAGPEHHGTSNFKPPNSKCGLWPARRGWCDPQASRAARDS